MKFLLGKMEDFSPHYIVINLLFLFMFCHMPSSRRKLGFCQIQFDKTSKEIKKVIIQPNIDLNSLMTILMNNSSWKMNSLYNYPEFNLDKNAKKLMEKILEDAYALIKKGEILLAANLADALFSACTPYWVALVREGKHIIAKEFWKEILNTVVDWENQHNVHIHKGTPYYFLSHTCLLLDDLENAFVYLGLAYEEDKKICKKAKLGLEKKPSYLTLSLSSGQENFMYPFVREMRALLDEYRRFYNRTLRKSLSLKTIDKKFFGTSLFSFVGYWWISDWWIGDW